MRNLSGTFINELKYGMLNSILELVKIDSTLCLEIREDYINIYYRGGNILEITKKGNNYIPYFDRNYFNGTNLIPPSGLPNMIENIGDVQSWIDVVPFLKHGMDKWFGMHVKNEREYQQVMVRENNFCNPAKSTDYFICDIEYANNLGRFDLVAVLWPSSAVERKNTQDVGLAFIEMKYMDGALNGDADILKHLDDMEEFLFDPNTVPSIKEEMKILFNQKVELGLINNQKIIESFDNQKPEYIFVLANHDPDSTILKDVLDKVKKKTFNNFALKFAVSNFMGYGLYQQNIYSLDEFMERFKEQIYSK